MFIVLHNFFLCSQYMALTNIPNNALTNHVVDRLDVKTLNSFRRASRTTKKLAAYPSLNPPQEYVKACAERIQFLMDAAFTDTRPPESARSWFRRIQTIVAETLKKGTYRTIRPSDVKIKYLVQSLRDSPLSRRYQSNNLRFISNNAIRQGDVYTVIIMIKMRGPPKWPKIIHLSLDYVLSPRIGGFWRHINIPSVSTRLAAHISFAGDRVLTWTNANFVSRYTSGRFPPQLSIETTYGETTKTDIIEAIKPAVLMHLVKKYLGLEIPKTSVHVSQVSKDWRYILAELGLALKTQGIATATHRAI